MKLFDFWKKEKILDLSNYKEQNELDKGEGSGDLVLDSGKLETPEEKKKKLAKRIVDLTDEVENLSNQIYHLQQRIEVLERKLNVSHSD